MDFTGKTIAITGIGGFIGFRLAERAKERGLAVRGLERAENAAERPRALGAEVIIGDVTDPSAAARAVEGADVVVHTAAVVTEDGPRELFERVNVGGTRVMCEAAARAGVQRFVQLSSVMVYGFRYPADVDEDGPLRGEGNPYCETKIASEREALSRHRPGALEVIVIRPGDVYGARSVPWVLRPVSIMRQGKFFLIGGGRGIMNHVHVDNLIDGIFLALEKDATGRALNVTDGGRTTFADYFGRLWTMIGKSGSPPSVPAPVAWAAASAMAFGARLRGREPPASPTAVRFLLRPHAYSIARARRDLGYSPRVGLDQGLREVEAALREAGQL